MKYLKNISKRFKKMGQGASHPGSSSSSKGGPFSSRRKQSGATPPTNYDLPPLRFHLTHGENIALSPTKEEAIRSESFCKGIVFSNRPVMVNERVCIRIAELNSRWNGVLRIGFSAHDPASLPRPLPKYACPDLTSKPGYWAKALSERYVGLNKLIHYHVSGNGDVHFGIDGEDLGVFFSGVDTRTPLWALIDLYGNCTSIELVDTRKPQNNAVSGSDGRFGNGFVRSRSTENTSELSAMGSHSRTSPNFERTRTLPRNSGSSQMPQTYNQPSSMLTVSLPPTNHSTANPSPVRPELEGLPTPYPNMAQQINVRPQMNELDNQFRRLSTEPNNVHPPIVPLAQPNPHLPTAYPLTNAINSNVTSNGDLRFNRGITFHPMNFHLDSGKHAKVINNGSKEEDDRKVAFRHADEFSQGYVFSQDIVSPGERIVIKILETELNYVGSLAFGLTNCDPSSINLNDLPEDSDLLLDRAEYWVVSKDVADRPDVGDELSFQINMDGSVEFSKNGNIPSAFMHVDVSLPLWAFWDIFGTTSKIRLIGRTKEPVVRFDSSSVPMNATALPSYSSNLDSDNQINSRTNNTVPDINRPQQSFLPSNISTSSANNANASANSTFDAGTGNKAKAEALMNNSFGSNSGGPSECTLCFENLIDCVLYTCGHMCMCYDCAYTQWKRGGGFCPLCRTDIRDVIRTFRS